MTLALATNTKSATGDMYISRLSESSFSFSFVSSKPCSTDLRALANVAEKHATKPTGWNSGSALDAIMIPRTMGTKVMYVCVLSLCRMMNKERSAVKNGVVAPMAWLKETGMNRSEMLPPTTDATKTTARTAILIACFLPLMACLGTTPDARTAMERNAHITCF